MATTKTKKEILDYLWEWAANDKEWGKLLVKRIVDQESNLSKEEIENIYNHFLKEIGLKDKIEIEQVERPIFKFKESTIQLKLLSDIKGINKLAKNQKLNFSKNITVIYGETATGKSGYSRILKALGFSYEKETKVLPNVYAKKKSKQKAKIFYSLDGVENEFVWNGSNFSEDLQNISVFTNNCVNISLGSRRELIVTPIGFHLFSLLSDELNSLAEIHKDDISKLKTDIDWLENLNEGTNVFEFLKNLNEKSQIKELETLASFSQEDEKRLERVNDERKNLNKKLLENKIQNFKNQFTELNSLKENVNEIEENISSNDWKKLGKYLEKTGKLKELKKKGLKEIAERRGIEFFNSEEFKNFIQAADEYLKKLNKLNYPESSDEICIYCRQKLSSEDSLELLRSYRKLLHDSTQDEITSYENRISTILEKLNKINTDLKLYYSSFGSNEKGEPNQPKLLTGFCQKIRVFQEIAKTKDYRKIKAKRFDINYKAIIRKLNEQSESINEQLNAKAKTLNEIETKEKELTKQIEELSDRKKLAQKIDEVKGIVRNIRTLKILKQNTNCFSTNAVSRKASEARKNLIAGNFNEIFQKELKDLRRSEISVNIDFKTEKGKSLLIQNIRSEYTLSEVLSEGEQKSIALAEFLTELQLEKSNAPIIFDDPVTSLDHHIIDEVARRLVKLSRDRQVVIFTHSILLFNSIKQKSELNLFNNLEFKYYETQKDLENTGYLYESPTLKENSFNYYKKRINEILGTPKEERKLRENELAIEGYNKLRAAIEVLVENDILKSTVKRYRKNVALTSFERINGELIDKHKEKLYSIFERCSAYTDAHSNITQEGQEPSLEELKIDLDAITAIKKVFSK
jgi:energy-coupling factor transporter ATP-binding protein EcfA2